MLEPELRQNHGCHGRGVCGRVSGTLDSTVAEHRGRGVRAVLAGSVTVVTVLLAAGGCRRESPPAPPAKPTTTTSPAKPTSGGEVVTNSVGMKLAYVPAGTFMMGSPPDEANRDDDETQRKVTLTRGFYIGTTEVTQKQWQAVMGFNPAETKADDLPASRISWANALAFCRKLGRAEGRTYRLPTEAEWEYACRARAAGPVAGTGKLDEMGWHIDNSDERPRPVATKGPNAWGLFDMHGNAMEWCADRYARDVAPEPATDPAGPAEGAERVARGGSWGHYPRACRAAARASVRPAYQLKQVGFRVVMEAGTHTDGR